VLHSGWHREKVLVDSIGARHRAVGVTACGAGGKKLGAGTVGGTWPTQGQGSSGCHQSSTWRGWGRSSERRCRRPRRRCGRRDRMRTGGRSADLGSLIDGGGEIREEVEAKDGMCELLTTLDIWVSSFSCPRMGHFYGSPVRGMWISYRVHM
jgi:hypothetical protein